MKDFKIVFFLAYVPLIFIFMGTVFMCTPPNWRKIAQQFNNVSKNLKTYISLNFCNNLESYMV